MSTDWIVFLCWYFVGVFSGWILLLIYKPKGLTVYDWLFQFIWGLLGPINILIGYEQLKHIKK